MNGGYIVSIDQSTQGTKALLFDGAGKLLHRSDLPHRQLVNPAGWVSHDLVEIYGNTIQCFQNLIQLSGIDSSRIKAVGISNQRETTAMWERGSGKPLETAVVWQCGRAEGISRRIGEAGYGSLVREKTGIPLSGYFPASKMAWLLQSREGLMERAQAGEICLGTIDSYLIYRLTGGMDFATDYSNASRTQLFDITELKWDASLCRIFGIPMQCLAQVRDSDACFGYTDFEGTLKTKIPILGVLGDSHGALYGQGCHREGMVKATYGTGSSLMMHAGDRPVQSRNGAVTSLAWGIGGKVEYVLEGNLNYTGAVISWLQKDLGLIASPGETEELAKSANLEDRTYLVPAFTGLGAPYWDARASAAIVGMTRTTGRAELVKAALECIGYQIADLVKAMEQDTGRKVTELRTDGGVTHNGYLMQFQSDILGKRVAVSGREELSGIGAAYLAGIRAGLYEKQKLFEENSYHYYEAAMEEENRAEKYGGWKQAVDKVLTSGR